MHVKCAQNYIYTTVFKTKAIKESFLVQYMCVSKY